MKKLIMLLIMLSSLLAGGYTNAVILPKMKPEIRVIFFYTPEILNDFGSIAALQAKLSLIINDANTSYGNNQFGFLISAIDVIPVSGIAYTQSVSQTGLNNFSQNFGVLSIRNKYQADFSVLLTKSTFFGNDNNGNPLYLTGIAHYPTPGSESFSLYYANTAFSVVGLDSPDTLTLVHEMGHNMGLAHPEGGIEVFSYGKGYGVLNEFATVMAYPQNYNSAHLAAFSTPRLALQATGTPIGTSDANAERAVNNSKSAFTNYGEYCYLSPSKRQYPYVSCSLKTCCFK
jgi:hypothetical protein